MSLLEEIEEHLRINLNLTSWKTACKALFEFYEKSLKINKEGLIHHLSLRFIWWDLHELSWGGIAIEQFIYSIKYV